MSNHTNCHKCAGTGVVSVFLHVKDGACFDCDGTGRLDAAVAKVVGKLDTFAAARIVGDAVIADPASVGHDIVAAALGTFEGTFRGQWSQKDYSRRNALAAIVEGVKA